MTTKSFFAIALFFAAATLSAAPQYISKHQAFFGPRAGSSGLSADAVPACCTLAPPAMTDARQIAKYGRLSPAAETRRKAALQNAEAHARVCVTQNHCPLPTPVAVARIDERLRSKYGVVSPAPTTPPVTASSSPCDQPCCRQAE